MVSNAIVVKFAIFIENFERGIRIERKISFILIYNSTRFRTISMGQMALPAAMFTYVNYTNAQAQYRQKLSAQAWTPIRANVHFRGQYI